MASEKRASGQRGKGRSHAERQAAAIDRLLTRWIESGVQVLDPSTGSPKLGPDGKPLRREPTASHLKVAITWMQARANAARTGRPLDLGPESIIDRATRHLRLDEDAGPFQIGGVG